MKYVLCSLALVVGMCASAAIAEEGRVSQDTLAAMGLSDLAPMSDAQGQEVKGKFAWAYSVSGTAVPGAFNVSGAGATGNYVAFAKSGSQSSGVFGVGGFGFIGPFGFGGAVFGGYAVKSSGYAFASGF